AVNAGDKDAAAAISCASFRDRAHGAAVTGADPGITFALGEVRVTGTTATATLTEHLVFAGTTSDTRVRLSVVETSGRWLVCGTA
ncbi:MAG TPA: hypothetical protein VGN18_09920, partial [Jatrophihabitans sp.]|uniref:hypothetical protein n=1 Tax=Jatrophihabitans sp. TaxID=1932789 RepID=UPI002DFF5D11|nr:hypothetical protein [Jatrophihabitans sp.]